MIGKTALMLLMLAVSPQNNATAQRRLLTSDVVTLQFVDSLRIAVQADWILQPADVRRIASRRNFAFKVDKRCKPFTAANTDYLLSGYERGHLCPAADRQGDKARMKETFLLSNVVPQVPSLNRGEWKILEEATRELARSGLSLKVRVCCIFYNADTTFIGRNRVAVPHALVKQVRLLSNDSLLLNRYYNN